MPTNRFSLAIFIMAVLALPNPTARAQEKVVHNSIYDFQGTSDGQGVAGSVVFDQEGNLYGATTDGGAQTCPFSGCGTVFQLISSNGQWSESVLYVFQGLPSGDGAAPEGGLILDSSGNRYGTTGYGGVGPCVLLGVADGCGTVFELSGTVT